MFSHAQPGSARSRWLLLAAVVLAGTVLSFLGYWAFQVRGNDAIEAEFQLDAANNAREVSRRFSRLLSERVSVRAPGGAIATREEFRTTAEPVLKQNTEIQAVYWIPRVPAGQRAEHEQEAGKEGLTEYRIAKASPDGALTEADAREQPDFFPAYYVEPQSGSRRMLGFDFASDPVYWETMLRAWEGEGFALSPRVRLTRTGAPEYGVLYFRAVYPSETYLDREPPEVRRPKLMGFTAMAIRLGPLMENVLDELPGGINVQMFLEMPDGKREFAAAYDSHKRRVQFQPLVTPPVPGLSGEPAIYRMSDLRNRQPDDRTMIRRSFESMPTEAYVAGKRTPLPLISLFVGLLITAIVATAGSLLVGRAAKVEELVIRRTAELRQATESLELGTAERMRAEADLAYERFLLTTLMNASPDYIYFKDAQSRFLRVSRALAVRFGLADPLQAIGETDFDFFEHDRAAAAFADEQEVMRTGRPVVDKEETQRWPDGVVTWVTTTKVRLVDETGEPVGTFGISRDITDRRQSAAQLQAAKETAEAASGAKSTFLANMSHEIRTPLNAIIGMTELVLTSPLSKEQRERLAVVQESGELLLSVINDILDFSKIEAGRLELESALFDLRESLGDTMKWLAMRAHAKGLELACRIAPDLPDTLLGDNTRLRQIVVNLVGNAIKFTERGEVVLEVERQDETDQEIVLRFSVTDTGIGIPKHKLRRIFEAFEQADNTMTRRFGGTGLGLPISSRLVELFGGRIGVESEVGRGSCFHFTARFQLAHDETAKAPPARLADVLGLRMLVVDDNTTNRRILEEMLRNWQMKPATVAGGREALEAIRAASQAGSPYRLVLSDVNMPEMDGFLLAEKILQNGQRRGQCSVIMMLTSGDRTHDIARCDQLGVAAYLVKPIKPSELFDAVMLALGIGPAEEAEAEKAADQTTRLRPLRILLAEDSLVNQKLAVGLLESHGHAVVVANQGAEAVARIDAQPFDLILMDIQMPEMDGLEATSLIRAKERQSGRHVPIIAMTAHAMKGDRERCLEAGMDEYVAKPIRARLLFQTIEAVLGSAGQPAESECSPQDTSGLDWSEAVQAVDGDRELLKTLVQAFLQESHGMLESVRQAVRNHDAAGLQCSAHKLKGAIHYFGAASAFEAAFRLEMLGKSGGFTGAEETLGTLEGELKQIIPDLESYLQTFGAVNPS